MNTTSPTLNHPSPVSVSDSLLVALFFATIMHVLLFIGVSFDASHPEKINKSIAITIANISSKKAPKKAEFLAQSNQIGAGKETKKTKPPAQKLPAQGKSQKNKPAKKAEQKKPASAKRLLTADTSENVIQTAEKSTATVSKKLPQISTESLVKQIANLGAQIRYNPQSSEQSRIKFVNSVSAHKYQASQYILDWQRKVERTGNMNYPEVARKKHFNGSLSMDVGINPDGSIYSIRINRSSGDKALDDAAKRIVKMSAPFAPLPVELLKELDVLIITRVWQFSDESGMAAK